MQLLPTGQVLFSDGSISQLWVYTPDGPPNPALRPVVNKVVFNGGSSYTLTGKQLNGQSAGTAFGDDVENDSNYPVVLLRNAAGKAFYARTTNWSNTGVATGPMSETVDFTTPAGMPKGNYSLVVSGAGIISFPVAIAIR
jgi:hypothetical protein